MAKATVDTLSDLHGLIAQWSIDKLKEQVPINAMGPEGPVTIGYRSGAEAKDIAVMTKFLNDNKITADVRSNEGLNTLQKELSQKVRHSDNVVAMPAAAEAAEAVRGVRNA